MYALSSRPVAPPQQEREYEIGAAVYFQIDFVGAFVLSSPVLKLDRGFGPRTRRDNGLRQISAYMFAYVYIQYNILISMQIVISIELYHQPGHNG